MGKLPLMSCLWLKILKIFGWLLLWATAKTREIQMLNPLNRATTARRQRLVEEPWQNMDNQLNDCSKLVRMLLGLHFCLLHWFHVDGAFVVLHTYLT